MSQDTSTLDNTRTRTASSVKLAYLAANQTPIHPTDVTSTQSTPLIKIPPLTPTLRPLPRERSLNRDDHSPNRSPSIRSATSFGRSANRLMTSQHTRHPSGYSNFSTMSEVALPWTTQDIGFNAISGVLNDPARRSQDISKPNKVDIPPVNPTPIPRIKSSDFDAYINHITPSFEKYYVNKILNHHEEPTMAEPVELPEDDTSSTVFKPHSKRTTRNPYKLPPLSQDSLLEEEMKPAVQELPMLENVPSIFFEPEFHLENPQTFDTVCEGADIISLSGNHSSVSTNSILQEKLSYYLDTVEVHLLHEIENRSSSFFEALSNLQALHQQTVDCVSQIHTIRKKMKKIQDTECKDGLEVIRLQVRKRNLERLYSITELIKNIRSVQPRIQLLLGEGNYFGALDLIYDTKAKLRGESGDIDLNELKSLSNFAHQLEEMEKAVGIMMQHDFLSILLSDLSFHIERLDIESAGQQLLKQSEDLLSSDTTYKEVNLENEHELKERLNPSAIGLIRTDLLSSTMQGYKEQLMAEIKELVRKQYPAISSPTESEEINGNIAKQLKSMQFVSFFKLIVKIFSILIAAIERASVYHHLILSLVEDRNDSELKATITKESADILFSAADLAHVRCGKLIGFRSDSNSLLNPTDFYRFSGIVRTFIVQCEMYCGRTCFGLRGNILSQQKAFLDHFHMERVKQETQLIENEQWAACEVPSDFQFIVDKISDGTIDAFVKTSYQKESLSEKTVKHLILNGNSYYVVGCTLLILKLFEEYLKCVLHLENMTAEITQKLIELLKLFNSRVCQVILGAGAMRSAGLKNITAKHLALASQSLAVMIVLTPKLRDCISKHIGVKHTSVLSEFDRVKNDFHDHQGEIHGKLVAIMNERFTAHAKAMHQIQWDEEESSSVNNYMETLVTETNRLHKVLSKYLPPDDLKV
ncbi:Vps54-like protein-domain-containing protein [Pilobolus umbonatus]|nr:Vps54-like protein-domain-containing protein [Pilobolus umbonatus]